MIQVLGNPQAMLVWWFVGGVFALFGKVNSLRKTPAYSIIIQTGIATFMMISASFDKLLTYIGFTLSLFTMLKVVGMIVLRKRQPALKRSYKTFGYPVIPILFIMGNLWIIYFSVKSRPFTSLFCLETIGLGLFVYVYFRRRGQNHEV